MAPIGHLIAVGEVSDHIPTIGGHRTSTEAIVVPIVATEEGEVAKNTAEAVITTTIDGTMRRLASLIKMKRHVTITIPNNVLILILIMLYTVIMQTM